MNDLQTLDDAWTTPEPPSVAAYAQARAALLAHATQRRPPRRRRRRLQLRLAAVGGLAAALAIGIALSVDGDRSGSPGVPIASAEVLERAADAAEDKPFTAPREDQWVYIEDRFVGSDDGPAKRWPVWRRADGRGYAWEEGGEVKVEITPAKRGGPRAPLESYAVVAALPRDPDALLRWAYDQAKHVTGAGLTEDGDVYAIFNGILRNNVLPPDLEAAVFRTLKLVPGVTVERVTVLGTEVLALGQTEDWLREELLLDPETYAYRGERSIVVRDAVIDPEKAGNETGQVKKGGEVIALRVETGIVDRPGERP
jgi:hypothetical protein